MGLPGRAGCRSVLFDTIPSVKIFPGATLPTVAWAVNRRCKEPRQWFIDTSDEDYKRLCFGLIQPNQ